MKTKTIITLVTLLFSMLQIHAQKKILNVGNYGANGIDNKDDTKSFQDCADDLSKSNGGTMYIPKGKYYISHLKFFGIKYSNITIDGNESSIIQIIPQKRIPVHNNYWKTYAQRYSADGCFVFDANVSNQKDDLNSIKNIKIKNLNFYASVDKVGFDELLHQISAHGVSDFSVENCSFTGFLGDGLAISAGSDLDIFSYAYNKNVTVKNCKFDGLNKDNRQGISIYYCDGFTIDNCHFQNTTRNDMPGAIDIEPNLDTQVSRNGTISNCSFKNIGGIAAICVVMRESSALNQYSNTGYTITNCTFEDVNSPIGVIGNESFKNYNSNAYNVTFQNSIVKNTKTAADMRSAYGVLFENINYTNITTTTNNTVTDAGASLITFKDCNFTNVSNTYGLGFTGETKKINFTGCNFTGFNSHAITINDPKGVGNISDNNFNSTAYPGGFPVVIPYINNSDDLKTAVVKNNKSAKNFKEFNSFYYFLQGEKQDTKLEDLKPKLTLNGEYSEKTPNIITLNEGEGTLNTSRTSSKINQTFYPKGKNYFYSRTSKSLEKWDDWKKVKL